MYLNQNLEITQEGLAPLEPAQGGWSRFEPRRIHTQE